MKINKKKELRQKFNDEYDTISDPKKIEKLLRLTIGKKVKIDHTNNSGLYFSNEGKLKKSEFSDFLNKNRKIKTTDYTISNNSSITDFNYKNVKKIIKDKKPKGYFIIVLK